MELTRCYSMAAVCSLFRLIVSCDLPVCLITAHYKEFHICFNRLNYECKSLFHILSVYTHIIFLFHLLVLEKIDLEKMIIKTMLS